MKQIYAILIGIALLFTGYSAQAQNLDITVKYVTEHGKEVSPAEAAYFIVAKEDSLGGGTRTKFKVGTNVKVSLTTYQDIDGGKYGYGIQHGPSYEWYENGQLKMEQTFHNDSLTGNYRTWYESGKPKVSRRYFRNMPVDTLHAYYESGMLRRTEVYSKGKMIAGKVYDEAGAEIKYLPMEVMPAFPGGERRLLQWLATNVRYPKTTRKDEAQGEVFISFVVDKSGRISNPEVIKGFHADADAEALRVVQAMPTWKPGLQEGEPVPVRYTLPLRFSLH